MKKYLSFCLLLVIASQVNLLLGMQAKKERARQILAKTAQLTTEADEGLKRADAFAVLAEAARGKFATESRAQLTSEPISMAPVEPEDDLDGEEAEEIIIPYQDSSSSWLSNTLTWAMCAVGALVVIAGLTDLGIRTFKKK